MTLELHQKCKQRICQVIEELISLAEVEHGNCILFSPTFVKKMLEAEKVFPQTEKSGKRQLRNIKSQLEEVIGDTPIWTFIVQTLTSELIRNQQYDSDAPSQPLVKIPGFEKPAIIAEQLVTALESLPWKYSIAIELQNDFGQMFAKHFGTWSINDSVKLITPSDEFAKQFPIKGTETKEELGPLASLALGLIAEMPIATWNQSTTYLQIITPGFIGQYGENNTEAKTISILKAFCGIGIALRLFKHDVSYQSVPIKSQIIIHRDVEGFWQIERNYTLDASVSDAIHRLTFNDLDGKLESEESKLSWTKAKLNEIGCVFEGKERAEKLLLGSQWLFDSFCGNNELLSFVQSAVVLEILLGDKATSDIMGLGELLRNRCAYLIGKSQQQRDNILNEFKQIYDVRSRIVHRGKSRLDSSERILFWKLQWMCRRVIQEEVKLLQKDIEKQQ